jgi:hypothetical protein
VRVGIQVGGTLHGSDLLFLQRHNRDRVFDLAYARPRPIVPRRDCQSYGSVLNGRK